jgi:uroporphyrinogen decarboxylase
VTSKERFLAALDRKTPDRLPVTTHHVMDSFLKKYLDGASSEAFFDAFGLDPILWLAPQKPDGANGQFYDPAQPDPGPREPRRVVSDDWRIETEDVPGGEYETVRYRFVTPKKTLITVLQSSETTSWITERLVKEKSDIDVIGEFVTAPLCDVEEVNRRAAAYGERGLVRGAIVSFDVYGQSGCWQDAACLVGIEKLILETFDDPGWVHALLKILFERKKTFVRSLAGARFDLIEHGGGDASSTVISPRLFDEFVAPYDAELTRLAHEAGQRVVYHTCGGMMPFLERIAGLGVDAMETFTPPGMGGDADLREAKRRIGGRVCMIGGFDQFHFFTGCAPEDTRHEVRRLFEAAGPGGGFILSPSDHFFEADLDLIRAYAEEGRRCVY